MTITREQVRANRQQWADFLCNPGRKKAQERLDFGNGERCCIGHGCYALDIRRVQIPEGKFGKFGYGLVSERATAPLEFMDMVGLRGSGGHVGAGTIGNWSVTSLIDVNDDTHATPQEIGQYLQTVIEGGEDTPFLPLSDYPSESAK